MRPIDADALYNGAMKDEYFRFKEKDKTGIEVFAYSCAMERLVEALTVDRWVSVKDMLPDEDGRYLTYHGQSQMKQAFGLTGEDLISISTWSKQRGSWWSIENNRPIIGITYWQVLPEPPKEDDNDAEQ